MVAAKTRDVHAGSRGYRWSPTKFFQKWIRFLLYGIRDDFAEHWRKFKSVSAITCSDHETFAFRIGRDPKISIMRFAIHAYAGVNNWSVGQHGKCP